MKKSTIYVVAWISTGIAVSVAIYVTKSAYPLLGMLIPWSMDSDEKED